MTRTVPAKILETHLSRPSKAAPGLPHRNPESANSHFQASPAASKLEQRLWSFDNVEMTSDFVNGGFCGVRYNAQWP
jgi:hypothetical protein